MCNLLLRFYCSTLYLFFNCYFIRVYIVAVFSLICGICSSVICLSNDAIYLCSFIAPIYGNTSVIVTANLLVTIKGYLLACLTLELVCRVFAAN